MEKYERPIILIIKKIPSNIITRSEWEGPIDRSEEE